MRLLAFLALMIAAPALLAQEAPKKKKQQQAAHKKPTPEQIRKFQMLEKKALEKQQKRS